jgi:hypothetical protein
VLQLIHTPNTTWRIDRERRLVLTPEGTVRAYHSVTTEPGAHIRFQWQTGPLGEQRATHGGRVVAIEDATTTEGRAFDARVD